MNKTELTLSNEDFFKYLTENKKLINLHSIASDDYVSYRCLYLNEMLDQAYVLAEQAIEKELKLILLAINSEENMRKFNNHRIEKLINRIQSLSDLGLDKFLVLGKRLSDTYEVFRYPDNKIGHMVTEWEVMKLTKLMNSSFI